MPMILMRPRLLSLALCALIATAGPYPAAAVSGGSPYYRATTDRGIAIPAVPLDKVPRRFLRQTVRFSGYRTGSIVVDSANHFLYFVESPTSALRYGVSVGKGAFAWSGKAVIAEKRSWPRWTPPAEMIARAGNLAVYDKGLAGSLFNPLGARALYLHQGRRDTLYRIHGTSEWWSIGDDSSSGCIRLLNQDIIDLAARVAVGTSVIVLQPRSVIIRRP